LCQRRRTKVAYTEIEVTATARHRQARPDAELMSRRADMINKLADAGLTETQAAVDALCEATLRHVAQATTTEITAVRARRDTAWDWLTRDNLSHQLRGFVGALAIVLGNPQDTKAAHR